MGYRSGPLSDRGGAEVEANSSKQIEKEKSDETNFSDPNVSNDDSWLCWG